MILDELLLTTFIISGLLVPYGVIFNKFNINDPITRFFLLNLLISIISREWIFTQLFLACLILHSTTNLSIQSPTIHPPENLVSSSEPPCEKS